MDFAASSENRPERNARDRMKPSARRRAKGHLYKSRLYKGLHGIYSGLTSFYRHPSSIELGFKKGWLGLAMHLPYVRQEKCRDYHRMERKL